MYDFYWIVQVSISSVILILLVHHLSDYVISYFSNSDIKKKAQEQKYIDARQSECVVPSVPLHPPMSRQDMKENLRKFVRTLK